MKHLSPLRYPGGKACLKDYLETVIRLNSLEGLPYYEPYAGGAGAALELLNKGVVSNILINDADPRIFSLWHSILNEPNKFVDRIFHINLDIEEWCRQQNICKNPSDHSIFDVGFAAFYMNRCNRSGVLLGAGPIGGMQQSGKWKLDVRFTRENLAKRVLAVAKMREQIQLFNSDAIAFLKANLPKGRGRSNCFTYLDPPYVVKGRKLYMNSYLSADHAQVAKYILSQKRLQWLMSYDDADLIRRMYSSEQIIHRAIKYSLNEKRYADELVISPWRIKLPTETIPRRALAQKIAGDRK